MLRRPQSETSQAEKEATPAVADFDPAAVDAFLNVLARAIARRHLRETAAEPQPSPGQSSCEEVASGSGRAAPRGPPHRKQR